MQANIEEQGGSPERAKVIALWRRPSVARSPANRRELGCGWSNDPADSLIRSPGSTAYPSVRPGRLIVTRP
jgi:hypothetical protein